MVVSSIRNVAVCAVTSAGASRMNDANDANANLPTIEVPPCLAVTPRSAVVEGKSSSVLRARADRGRVARHKDALGTSRWQLCGNATSMAPQLNSSRMTAFGTSRTSQKVQLESAKWAKADIDQIAIRDFMSTALDQSADSRAAASIG